MSKWELSGNEAAETRLRAAAARGALSHALLFSGGGDCLAAACFAAAALECTAPEGERPCGVCAGCRKVRQGIHPDVTAVRDPEHKNLAMDVVRAARSDAWIRPNEGARKVYVFEDCALLTEADQNVLLKVVEEGPPYAAFLFCAENPGVLLPTLRSRCVEVKLRPAETEASPDGERARGLCRAVVGKKAGAVTELLVRLEREKLSREELQAFLEETRSLFGAALLAQYGGETPPQAAKTAGELGKSLTKVQIMRTIELLQKYSRDCIYNVGVGQVLGALAVELEGNL